MPTGNKGEPRPIHRVISHIRDVLPIYGSTTVHNQSGRLFQHIHNHDVSCGLTSGRFNLESCKGRDKAAVYLQKCREIGIITHVCIVHDGDAYLFIPIQHVTDHRKAGKLALERGESTYATRTKRYGTIIRNADQSAIPGVRHAREVTRRDSPFICQRDTQESWRSRRG